MTYQITDDEYDIDDYTWETDDDDAYVECECCGAEVPEMESNDDGLCVECSAQ